MARLVVGGVALVLVGHDHALALGAHEDLVLGLLEVDHLDPLLAGAGGVQGGLVAEVGQVGAGEAGGAAGDDLQVHVRGEGDLVGGVHLEDLEPALEVGAVHHHPAVEAAGAEQGGIQHVGAVGGGDQDHAFVAFEAVHLHQQLVEGLLALVVAAAQARRRGAGPRRRSRR